MIDLSELLSQVEAYAALNGIAESTFGRLAVNDGKLVARLRAGRPITTDTYSKVVAFLAAPAPAKNKVA